MKIRPVHVFLPAISLVTLLVSCGPPAYHQDGERYVFVTFNTALPYWQEAEAGLDDAAKQMGVKAELVAAHLHLDKATLDALPREKTVLMPE